MQNVTLGGNWMKGRGDPSVQFYNFLQNCYYFKIKKYMGIRYIHKYYMYVHYIHIYVINNMYII